MTSLGCGNCLTCSSPESNPESLLPVTNMVGVSACVPLIFDRANSRNCNNRTLMVVTPGFEPVAGTRRVRCTERKRVLAVYGGLFLILSNVNLDSATLRSLKYGGPRQSRLHNLRVFLSFIFSKLTCLNSLTASSTARTFSCGLGRQWTEECHFRFPRAALIIVSLLSERSLKTVGIMEEHSCL